MVFQQSNGDTIVELGDITVTAAVAEDMAAAMKTGPFWYFGELWEDTGLPFPTQMPIPPGYDNGGGGSGTPPDWTPWYDLTPVADTACKGVANEMILFGADSGKSGVLNDKAMVDSMRGIWAEARAAKIEMGGWFVRTTTNGPIKFVRRIGGPLTDKCTYKPLDTDSPFGIVVGYFHTHQLKEGVSTICPQIGPWTPRNVAFGGGSDEDWDGATAMGRSWYTIDAENIWRLDPGVLPENRPNNPNRWIRQGAGCATRLN